MCLEHERKVTRSRFTAIWAWLFGWPLSAGFLGWLDFANWWGLRVIVQPSHPALDLDSVQTFLVVKLCILFFGSRDRNGIAGTIVWLLWCRNHSDFHKHGLRQFASLLFQSLKDRTHQSSEHLTHFEVVILNVNNWCLWDSENESEAYRRFSLQYRKEKTWSQTSAVPSNIHFQPGNSKCSSAAESLAFKHPVSQPISMFHTVTSVPWRWYSRSWKVGHVVVFFISLRTRFN